MSGKCASAISIHCGRVPVRAGKVERGGDVQKRRYLGGFSGHDAGQQQHDAGTGPAMMVLGFMLHLSVSR